MQECHEETARRIQRVKELEKLTAGELRIPSAHGVLREWPEEMWDNA